MESDSGRVEPECGEVSAPLLCPECHAGKHRSCAEFTVDEHDAIVPCECPECEHSDTGGIVPPYITDRIPGHEDDQP
jgi:hypothetical protein